MWCREGRWNRSAFFKIGKLNFKLESGKLFSTVAVGGLCVMVFLLDGIVRTHCNWIVREGRKINLEYVKKSFFELILCLLQCIFLCVLCVFFVCFV